MSVADELEGAAGQTGPECGPESFDSGGVVLSLSAGDGGNTGNLFTGNPLPAHPRSGDGHGAVALKKGG